MTVTRIRERIKAVSLWSRVEIPKLHVTDVEQLYVYI